MELPPALHLNPSDDDAFVAVVDRLLSDGLRDPGEFQHRLRDSYPGALVRPRDLAFEPFVVWYVYRDGRWTPPELGATS
ncbi:MAG TPA: hypothetical protein VFO05_12355 [Candidatus Limnocylindrales bacterium]|nr:hypothetical protein [Candidatus Limnocylindrales bacterium]